jgi:autotransporter-like protein
VPNITIDSGGRILAAANTTDPTNKAVTQLVAIAIDDRSNSLVTLNNAGTISATATPLTNGFTSVARAVDTSFNSVGLNFMNTGTVVGDVLLGGGADTYTIQGTSGQTATQSGDINFGTSVGGTGVDTLNVNSFANVSSAITDQGALDINIQSNATLTVKNLPTSVNNNLQVQNLMIAGGPQNSAGQLNITVSSGLANIPLIQASQKIDFAAGANLNVTFGGLVPQGGNFLLLSAPHGNLIFEDPNAIANFNLQLTGAGLPFLFSKATITTATVGGTDFLELNVVTRSATDLGLTGYAAQLFPIANVAISGDDALGAALVAGINSPSDAESAYNAFAPDVSGGTRAVALSLTDQATGVVAARERQLRMFAKSPGELTLWGNEFGEYLSTHGQTKTGVVGETLPADFVCNAKCPQISLSGFKDHGFGFSLGLDSGAPEAGWYGAAFTFYTGDVQAGPTGAVPNSKTGELWYLLTGYTDWRGKGLFLDTQISAGYGQLKGKRFLTLTIPVPNGFTTFSREADNTHAALVGAVGATAGAVMKYGATTVTPQISLDGMTLRQEGFSEANGGNGFNLRVRSSYANSLRIFLGTEARQDIDLGDFFLQPAARVGYRFDLLNGAEKVRAQFADIDSVKAGNQPGDLFTISGPDPSRGNLVGGLNLNATTDNWTIGLSYDFVRGNNNATEQTGTISLLGRI